MFYIQQDEKIVLFDENLERLQNTIAIIPQYEGLEIKEVQEGYVIYDFELMTVEEKEKKEAQKERERIAMLNLTAADVERGLYKAMGIDFDDVLTQVEAMPLAEGQEPLVDIKALKIELKANNFYRGNPYIETIGTFLGLTKEQLNKFFEYNDYRYLTNCTFTINPTPTDSTITINNTNTNTITVPYSTNIEYTVGKEGYITISNSIELVEDTTLDIELVQEGVSDGL